MSNANHKQNRADEQDNEIALVVGSLFNYTPAEDRESYEEEREWVQQIQDSLRQEGVIIDLMTNPGVQIWEGGIRRYGDLYRLSQAAAYIEQGMDITPLLNKKFTEDEDLDPILKQIIEGDLDTQFPHFIKPDGDPFFYLPIEFTDPIIIPVEAEEGFEFDEEDEDGEDDFVSFGSSPRLQRELYVLNNWLVQMQVPATHPVMRCLASLRQAAELSVTNDLPIVVW
ncbi:MAG: hypothetical protein DWI30_01545 [Chloroflexi bacterium]|nr:MAG: hypothetical protein DWI30_01545 [Chloroflexota bacterium]